MSEILEAIRRPNLPDCFNEWPNSIETRTYKAIPRKRRFLLGGIFDL